MSLHRCDGIDVMVRGVVALIRRVLHNLEVVYVGFIINAYARA
jgi:hypothetical protein